MDFLIASVKRQNDIFISFYSQHEELLQTGFVFMFSFSPMLLLLFSQFLFSENSFITLCTFFIKCFVSIVSCFFHFCMSLASTHMLILFILFHSDLRPLLASKRVKAMLFVQFILTVAEAVLKDDRLFIYFLIVKRKDKIINLTAGS